MIKIRPFNQLDYEEVVNMYYDFNTEIYPNRIIGMKIRYYEKVLEWIKNKVHIVVSHKDDIITGFSMCYVDTSGLTEPMYQCDICYVKPEFRKGRSAYLLYNNAVSFAKDNNIGIVSEARIENGTDEMCIKHFDMKPTYLRIERNR